MLATLAVSVGLTSLGTSGREIASAADAQPTASLSIQKAASDQIVTPGQPFTYTIEFQCTAGTVNGCVNAKLDDPMPSFITITGAPQVTGTSNFDAGTSTATELIMTFTDDLGGGQQGLAPGNEVTVQLPVQVADDAPPTADGQTLNNTATISADNATTKQASASVTLHVPSTLAASTTKSIDPSGGPDVAGSSTTVSVSGTNSSNVSVHQVVINDPVPQADGTPPTVGNPFTPLELSALDSVTPPAGADTVQARVYDNSVPGWVDGPVGNVPGNPTLPSGVDPANVTGIQLIFTDTTGDGIPPGASANVSFDVALRAVIPDEDLPLVITNLANTTVVDSDGNSATSDPASATYRIPPNEVDVSAAKTFDPNTVHVGDPSTVTLSGTNESSDPLDSMTITEPAEGTPNHLADGELAFTSMGSPPGGGVVWPDGATGATITYVCDGTPGSTQTATAPNTLPGPPDTCDPVTGFSVTFTGPINPGATASIPFVITTSTDQLLPEQAWTNTVGVEGERQGVTGNDTHTAIITTIKDRIAVDVDKTLFPTTIPSYPGQIVTAELSGQLLPFPASTVDASTIVVQDPANLPDPNGWYDSFNPRAVTATPVPGCSTLTVQFTTDSGATWVDIPGMESIQGATIFNGTIPNDVSTAANGIRFVYTADPPSSECSGGFPPGTSVSPNLSFAHDADGPVTTPLPPVTNCAASSGTTPTAPDATAGPACSDVNFTPVDPGSIDPIGKAWDQDGVIQRSQTQVGATLSWSTDGFTGTQRIDITDTENPDTTPITDSVFDSFDLVRIDPITPDLDPLLTYDEITEVQLYELPAGDTNPADGAWVEASNDPCPAACDGTFPGYNLTTSEVTNTIGFRLTYVESPTRADRLGTPDAPPVGSGVAESTGNNRKIHPVFQLRDVRRSDPNTPVTAEQLYNTATEGLVDNSVRLDPFWHVDDPTPILTRTADDAILITDVPLTIDATKTWGGGPLGIPQPGVPQSQYPTGRVTVTGSNTTPAKLDQLVITDPDTSNEGPESCTTNPFDKFNLVDFATITPPADIGATDVTITLTRQGGGTTNFTRDQALALTESDLTDVVGMTITYTGRIDAATTAGNPTAAVTFDTRLRTNDRTTGAAPQPNTTVCNQTHVQGADMVDFPGFTKSQDAFRQAEIDLAPRGIDVIAGKSFDPTSITEPSHGPVTVTLSGQPVGPSGSGSPPSRAVEMVLTDDSPTFWNTYDLSSLNDVTFTNPINRVEVDAFTGGTWSVVAGKPVLTGGSWHTGTPTAGPALSLPSGVTATQVQGLRFTFTRSDGANWENPADPTQDISFSVTRRDTLHTGGRVLTDLAQNPPAPGEPSPGVTTNTTTADVVSSDVDANGNPLTASDDADATILFHHANNAVQVGKTPTGDTLSPGAPFKYTMTFTNTGDVDITNPIITDVFPADAQGPQIQLAPDPAYSFAITGGTGMPTDPAQVTIGASETGIVFTFPSGSTLPIGATYIITYMALTRPGLAAGTQFTNTVGIASDRPWDACDGGTGGGLDPSTGQCQAIATNTVTSAGAIAVSKQVKAQGSDVLGVAIDPLFVSSLGIDCTANADGFYVRPCIPIAEPGGNITWRWQFVNSGNLPLDRILGIDRLPAPGDAVATAPDLARLSEWQPLLSGDRPTLSGADGTFNVFYTTGSDWCDGPQAQDGQLLCPALDWQEWPAGQPLPVDPTTVTGLQIEFLPDAPLAPAAAFDVDVDMTAPAFSPADTPNTTAMSDSDTYAFNTVGTAARVVTDGDPTYTLTTEPPRVGVGLAHGGLQVEKNIDGDAADQFAPTTFQVSLQCTSVAQDVPLGDAATVTLRPGTPVSVFDLPYHATCTLTEGDNGQTSSSFTSATVQRDVQDFETATLTNTYDFASLAVTKRVDTAAVDQGGNPIPYGPFTVVVTCTFQGAPDFATGYDPDHPMAADLSDGQTVTFTHLHPGASCVITETDDKGATGTTIVTTPSNGEPDSSSGTSTTIELDPDTGAHPPNAATVTNTFGVGSINLVKKVTGGDANQFGTGPFTLAMKCVLDDASGTRTVWDDTIKLGGGSPLQATVNDIATGATCAITEPANGGASAVQIDPSGPIPVDENQTATVTVTNSFDPGTLLVDKKVDGPGAATAPSSFSVMVTCSADGSVLPGFPQTVTVTPGTPTVVDTLVGAGCTAVETDTGQATTVTYDPPATVGSSGSGPVVISNDPQHPPTITITNTFPASGGGSNGGQVPPAGGGGQLAFTGGPVMGLLLWGLAALTAGAALSVLAGFGRRRGRHSRAKLR